MGILDELIKVAEAESAPTRTSPAPKGNVAIETEDIQKFANYMDQVGRMLKLGQEPEIIAPVTGEQAPVDGKDFGQSTTDSTVTGGELATNEEAPVEGDQAPVSATGKIAAFLMKKAAEGELGNVGLNMPGDSTGLPASAEGIADTSNAEIQDTFDGAPMAPLFDAKLETAEDVAGAALPEAVKESHYQMGKIAAHAFVNEMSKIAVATGNDTWAARHPMAGALLTPGTTLSEMKGRAAAQGKLDKMPWSVRHPNIGGGLLAPFQVGKAQSILEGK